MVTHELTRQLVWHLTPPAQVSRECGGGRGERGKRERRIRLLREACARYEAYRAIGVVERYDTMRSG